MDLLKGKGKEVENVRNPEAFPLYLYKQTLLTDECYSNKACMENKRDFLIPFPFSVPPSPGFSCFL